MKTISPRRLRRRLVAVLVIYFFAGAASQKLMPGGDEIFPFFGWSLFSKVPNVDRRFSVLIEEHDGHPVDPPISLQRAPGAIAKGNRYIARKVVQKLGQAQVRGDSQAVAELRWILEKSYLRGEARYQLVDERYDPLRMWRHGEHIERRRLATFRKGVPGEAPQPP